MDFGLSAESTNKNPAVAGNKILIVAQIAYRTDAQDHTGHDGSRCPLTENVVTKWYKHTLN